VGIGLASLPLSAQNDEGRQGDRIKGDRMEQMRQDLNLSDTQVEQITAIHKQYRPERKALKYAELKDPALEARRKQMREEEQAAVKAVLTPEQQARFDALKAQRHAGHHGHAEMNPAQRQLFHEQVLPLMQAQRLKLESALSAADKATVDRLRDALADMRAAHKDAKGGKRKLDTPPTEEDRARMAEFHKQRHAIMEEAAAVANRYTTQIQQLHEEVKPQLERLRAEIAALATTASHDDRGTAAAHRPHSDGPRHGGKQQMEAARFLLMDPARTPGQGRARSEKAEQIRLEVFPNPAVTRATLRYKLEQAGTTKVELIDGTGKVLRVLQEGQAAAGEHFIDLETTDLPAGTYYFRITDGQGPKVRALKVIH
jgi:Spy/CpxP family protein refolding chaperone